MEETVQQHRRINDKAFWSVFRNENKKCSLLICFILERLSLFSLLLKNIFFIYIFDDAYNSLIFYNLFLRLECLRSH